MIHPGHAGELGRVLAGLSAVALPRALGTALGLFRVDGGRGFWAFAELDSLGFLASAVVVLFAIRRGFSQGLLDVASFSGLLIVLVASWLSLGYVVTNYGTLFRLRETVLVAVALLPLAATAGTSPSRVLAP